MTRRLRKDEQALWSRVAATVTPLGRNKRVEEPPAAPREPAKAGTASLKPALHRPRIAPAVGGTATLDGTWDKRLKRGLVPPDLRVDLHGHGLASAYAHLDQRLEQALAQSVRVVLLITGKPRNRSLNGSDRTGGRGAIRAAVEDWLAASRHAAAIAAVRPAHVRHGGEGALYIILRQSRGQTRPKS